MEKAATGLYRLSSERSKGLSVSQRGYMTPFSGLGINWGLPPLCLGVGKDEVSNQPNIRVLRTLLQLLCKAQGLVSFGPLERGIFLV